MSPRARAALCGPDCSYRRLYEGSQASLTVMAGRQTEALGRVASLRGAVIEVLKQSYPTQFAAAEAQLGRRMLNVDDEVLMAFVRAFVTPPAQQLVPPGAEALRAALARTGVIVPAGYDLDAWAKSVATTAAALPTAQPAIASVAAQSVAPVGRGSTTSSEAPPDEDPGSTTTAWEDPYRDAPVDDVALTGSSSGFAGLFEEDNPQLAREVWGQMFSSDELFGGGQTHTVAHDVEPEVLVEALYTESSSAPSAPAAAPQDGAPAKGSGRKSSRRRRGKGATATPSPSTGTGAPFDPGTDGADFTDPYSDVVDELTAPPGDVVPAPQTPDTVATLTPAPAPAPSPAPPRAPAVAAVVPPAAEAAPVSEVAPAPELAPAAVAPPRTAAQAFKPELFAAPPTAKAGRGRATKTIKVTATRPSARTDLDVPVADAGEDVGTVDDFAKLREAVGKPRPVFTLDLVESTGSHDLVASWERHERGDSTSPVRFVGGSSRHQRRGALVVPYAPELRQKIADAGPSLWWDLIDEREGRTRLRGNFLYEAAVLAVRFGHEVVDHKVEPNLITLLLNSPGTGMRALVFWTGAQAPAGDDLTGLADAVEARLGARLGMIAVLTAITGEKSLEKIVADLSQEGQRRGWKPTMPVVATHAWEFALDGGASAHQVL